MQRCRVRLLMFHPRIFYDDREGGVTLEELFGGIHFAACCVMLVVEAEDTVNVVEEVALRGKSLQ